MAQIKVLYTAEATLNGGREGQARSSDLRLELDLAVPPEMGGNGRAGTNPEQLFAAGYAACFQSSLYGVAAGRRDPKPDLTDSQVTTRVGIGPTGHGGFGLVAALGLHAPNVKHEDATDLMLRADERCPYSNAIRGNVDVSLSGDGVPLRSPSPE